MLSRGCHALIKQGAKLVESAADILDELAWQQRLLPPVLPENSSDPLLAALDGSPATLDTLAQRTGLTLEALSAKLLTLELDGRIASLPGAGISTKALSQNTALSPVSARTMNSCERSPPIGPVSARIGTALSPMRLNVFR